MKINVKRVFRYQESAESVGQINPGVYSVPDELSEEMARKILRFGKAEIVPEKKAPENKVVKPRETKVAKKPVRRRSAGSKSDN